MFWYNLCLCLLMPFLLLFFTLRKRGQEKNNFRWRMGFYDQDFLKVNRFSERIWIHAASVGEVLAIVEFVKLLRERHPQAWIGISTMTGSGLSTACAKIPEANQHFMVPLDLFFSAKRAMRQIRPTSFITIETEIWPNLLKYAKRYGAKVTMVNGRLSARNIHLYLRYKRFFQGVLQSYDACSMISPQDAERIIAMGASPVKVSSNGNCKFDNLFLHVTVENHHEISAALNLRGYERILIAGSTREGEEELILKAAQIIKETVPDFILIIAPRHIQRTPEIIGLTERLGFLPLLRTEINPGTRFTPNTVIILNTIGELFKVYAVAKLAFCGGSLVPLGGQNPLEPAAWGKVVLYGPSMENFTDAKKLLEEAGSGIAVHDYEELAVATVALLQDEQKLEKLGAAGKHAIQTQQGSSRRNLEIVEKVIIH